MAAALMRDGYGWLSTSVSDKNLAVQMFVNGQTAEWVMVVIGADLDACIAARGTDWAFSMPGTEI